MDVKIGITQSVRELELDMEDSQREQLKADVATALKDDDNVLWLTDRKGRTVGIPSAKIGYVEIGSASEERKVGFAR
jgi:hypothetical protein